MKNFTTLTKQEMKKITGGVDGTPGGDTTYRCWCIDEGVECEVSWITNDPLDNYGAIVCDRYYYCGAI